MRIAIASALLIVLTSAIISTPATGQGCQRRMGPYYSIEQAETDAERARYAGYQTSGVWGEGGVISQSSNRRYFFNVFGPC